MHSVCPDLVHMQSEGTRVRRTSTSVAFDSSCLPSAPRVPSPASAQSVQNSSVKTRVSKTIGSADGPTRWRPGRSTPGRSRLSSESHTQRRLVDLDRQPAAREEDEADRQHDREEAAAGDAFGRDVAEAGGHGNCGGEPEAR